MLGVSQKTISNDYSQSEQKLFTRDEKEAEIKASNALLKLVKPPPEIDRYGTIVIDPPWEMEKIKRDVAPNQVAFDYPTMTEDELQDVQRGSQRSKSAINCGLPRCSACRCHISR